jgi:hypothetical protein
VSIPFVRLSIYQTGVMLSPPMAWLKLIVPYWQVRFQDVAVVERMTGRLLLAGGVRFRLTDGDYRIFWSFDWGEILAGLGQMGVSVDLEPHRFHPFFPSL